MSKDSKSAGKRWLHKKLDGRRTDLLTTKQRLFESERTELSGGKGHHLHVIDRPAVPAQCPPARGPHSRNAATAVAKRICLAHAAVQRGQLPPAAWAALEMAAGKKAAGLGLSPFAKAAGQGTLVELVPSITGISRLGLG